MKRDFIFFLIASALFSACNKDKSDMGMREVQGSESFPEGWEAFQTNTQNPSCLALDNYENIWYSGYSGTLQKRSGSILTDYSSTLISMIGSNSSVSSLAFDNVNQLWIGSSHSTTDSSFAGLIMYDGTNFYPYTLSNSGLHNHNIHSIAVDASNVKWIGTQNSLVKYDGTTWSYYDSLNSPLREFYPVICAFGYVWVTGQNSLKRFDGTTFTNWDASNSIFPSTGMRIVDKDQLGNLWFVGTLSTVLWKFDGISFTSFVIPSIYNTATSPGEEEYEVLKVDALNNIWLGGNGKLVKFDGSVWTRYAIPSFVVGGDPRLPNVGDRIQSSFYGMVIKSDSSKWFLEAKFNSRHLMEYNE